jgi:hypothetical protein
MHTIYCTPSFYAHILNGLLLLFAFILLYKNYSQISELEPFNILVLTLIFSISIGIHGMSHLGLEKNYGYNPMKLNY